MQTDDSTFWQQNRDIFANIKTTNIPSRVLLDYGYKFADLSIFDGTKLTDDNLANFAVIEQINSTLFSSQVDAPSNGRIPDPQTFYNAWKNNAAPNSLALSGVLYQYEQYGSNAANNLDVQGNQIFDKYVNGVWQNPYETKTCFAMALPVSQLNTLSMKVTLPSDMWVSNMSGQYRSVQADPGDGNGYRSLSPGSTFNVQYSTAGAKEWKFQVILSNGTVLLSHSTITVVAERRAFVDQVLDVTATEAYNNVYATGKISIRYASSDHILRHPLIIVEGFDPGNILTPQNEFGITDIEGAFQADLNNISFSNPLRQQIQNVPYDLVYVDWNNGTDYLERNALLLETIIRTINNMKSGTAKDVVWGMSMGGVIARYALKDMEDKGENHQVQYYISHDAPHLGAHVPMGFQKMADHLRSYWLGTGYLGATIQNYVIPLTGSLSINDGLSLAYQPAAAEMLINHISPWGNSMHAAWQQKLKNKGYPQQCTNYAISNGSQCGISQPFGPAETQMSFSGQANTGWLSDLILYFGLPLLPGTSTVVYSTLASLPGNVVPPGLGLIPGSNQWNADFWVKGDADNSYQQLYHGKISYTKKILWLLPITVTLTQCDYGRSGTYPWETFPGGYYGISGFNGGTYSGGSTAFGSFTGTLSLKNRFSFVPTASALDIGGGNVSLPKSVYQSKYIGAFPPAAPYNTSFAKFVTAYSATSVDLNNQPHILTESRNADWTGKVLQGLSPADNCSFVCPDNSIAGTSSVCAGNPQTFSLTTPAPTGSNVSWSVFPNYASLSPTTGPSTTLTATGNGPVTLTATVTACSGTVSFSKTIQVGAPQASLPNISVSSTPNCYKFSVAVSFGAPPAGTTSNWTVSLASGCTSGCITNGSGAGTAYYILTNGQKIVVSYSATNSCGTSYVDGIYHLSVTGTCPNTHAVLVYDGPAPRMMYNGEQVVTPEGDVLVYPNPAKTDWNVSFMNQDITDADMKMYDLFGKTIYSNHVSNARMQDLKIPNSTLSPGTYILKVNANTNTYQYKLIKE
ncbi:T9SS type A sorting domain-containing protein [Chitinophagaceae bacterium MMS25-I14]